MKCNLFKKNIRNKIIIIIIIIINNKYMKQFLYINSKTNKNKSNII